VRQLRFLEVTVDPVAVRIYDGCVGRTRVGVVADAHQKVGDVAVHWASDFGPAKVDFSLLDLDLCGLERAVGLGCSAGHKLFLLDSGSKISQRLTTASLELLHLQVGRPGHELSPSLIKCALEVERVDDVEHVALVNVLVINEIDARDLTRHLRRDACDLNTDPSRVQGEVI
jgi:hypothetical protein